MSDRKRDLAGFGSRPMPPPPETGRAKAAVPATNLPPVVQPRRERPPAKKRITLSLPTEVAALLRDESTQSDRYYLDIILSAFGRREIEILEAYRNLNADQTLGLRPLKRRKEPGRVQVALLISANDLDRLDASAKAVRLDRSSYVTELLTARPA